MRWALAIVLCSGCGFHNGSAMPDAAPPDVPPDVLPDVAPSGDWLSVVANSEYTCALKLDHTLWCWGDDQSGQLGLGSGANEIAIPTQVGTAQWTQLSAGSYHVCGLQTDGSLWCWGRNNEGELGIDESGGTIYWQYEPARVAGSVTFTQVAAGYLHTCAVASDQTQYCWGENSYGQFGTGTQGGSRVPVQVSTAATLQVAAGGYMTCAIRSDHSLWCSGYNYFGELGDGSSGSTTGGGYHLSPVQAAGSWNKVVAISIHTCGITTTGHLRCWGWNAHGNLGDGTTTDRWVPEVVGADHADWTDVAVGGQHTCGTRAGGALYCWGNDDRGQLALSEDRAPINASPMLVEGVTGVTSIGAGAWHTCAVTGTHLLECTGVAALGQLGDGTSSRRQPVQVAGGWDQLSAGYGTTCARASDGTLSCWGDNTVGELATNRAVPSNVPALASVPAPTAIATGAIHACEVTSAGEVWCWGYPSYEETGDPNAVRMTPGVVAGVTASVISARDHTCTIPTSGGGLWCWGNNFYAQLGIGSTTQTYLPNHVLTGQTFIAVAAGGEFYRAGRGHTCAINAATTLACWGDNYFGQIGNGTTSTTPVTSPALLGSGWSAVALGGHHSCAITSAGKLACWGQDNAGQLGDGAPSNTPVTTPSALASGAWAKVALGEVHTCGIQTDGTLWCWGFNLRGQLGDGTAVDKSVPTQVGTDTDWVAVTAGEMHTCALKSDQSLWCWGLGDTGQVGDGTAWRTKWAAVP
jgi:alpha-tubulin suppressor-like RCC1 family protein